MALLDIANLEASYGPVQALRGVSLAVPEGGIVALLGANGAGKTTVLKSISGVVVPERGSINFAGSAITGLYPDRIVTAGISHVPEGRETFTARTVQENLTLGSWPRQDRGAIAADLDRVFALVPILRDRRGHRAGQLSGGQQQMLAISRALMARPRLMLLDEPSLGLAPLLVREIFAVIAQLRQDGMTILLVEQNANMALEVADYGYIMETGRIVMEDRADVLRGNPIVQEFYLGIAAETEAGPRRYKRRKQW